MKREIHDPREITSSLLRSYRLAGSSGFTDVTSLGVRIVSDLPPVIRTLTGSPAEKRVTVGPKLSGLSGGPDYPGPG
jgi:hypothetical protein